MLLRAFGPPTLVGDDGQPIAEVVSQTKRFVLLTYLAVGDPAGCRRDTLLGLFWPELDESHARNSLRQALAVLRRALGEGILPADRAETIRITPDRLECDVTQFERKLTGMDLEGALELARGDFLAGVHVSGLPDVERWIEERRVALRRRAVRTAMFLADQANASGATQVSWAHRAVTLAPHDEPAWRKLIELHLRRGNVPEALATYDRLVRLLREEFESAPSPETQALVASLKR